MGTLITLLLVVIYGGGAFKFWTGFNRTNFLALNKSYRENFNRALKG